MERGIFLPSLCLENRSGAWGGVVRRASGRGEAQVLTIGPRLEKSSQGQVQSAKVKDEKGTEVLTLGTTAFAPSCHMSSIQDTFVPSCAVTLGNHFHLEAWVSPRKAICNFSSLHLAWTVESTF